MNRVRLRIGVKGRVVFFPTKATLVAVTLPKERYEEIVEFLDTRLSLYDGKYIGDGFTVFITGEEL